MAKTKNELHRDVQELLDLNHDLRGDIRRYEARVRELEDGMREHQATHDACDRYSDVLAARLKRVDADLKLWTLLPPEEDCDG